MTEIERQAIQQRIIEALACGNTRQDSYQYAGIGHNTFHRWITEEPDFAARCVQAEATSKVAAITRIAAAAAAGSWQAAAWFMERRFPREWGRVEKLDGVFAKMSREQIREFVATQLGHVDRSGDGGFGAPALLGAGEAGDENDPGEPL